MKTIRIATRPCLLAVRSGPAVRRLGIFGHAALLALFGLLVQAALFAEPPRVSAVVNEAGVDVGLSPGVVVDVYYTPVSPSDHLQNPQQTVTVEVGGLRALIYHVRDKGSEGGIAHLMLPRELLPGSTTLVITTSAGRSAPFPIKIDAHSPFLSDLVSLCATPEADGFLFAYGLGTTIPVVPTIEEVRGGQPRSVPTAVRPTVTVGGRAAQVLDSQLQIRSHGTYRVVYKLPPGTPDGRHPLVLTIGGHRSNTVYLVVGASNHSTAGGTPHQGAPESIVSVYGCAASLASGEVSAPDRTPSMSLGGTTVKVKDSAGVSRQAPLYYVSPSQVNYVVPSGTAIGPALVTITPRDGAATTAPLEVRTVAPGLFTVEFNCWCHWAPAGWVVRVRDGVQTIESVVETSNEEADIRPIYFGPETDQLYLVLLATGLRFRSSPAKVSVRFLLGASALYSESPSDYQYTSVPAEYAGPQDEFFGLDQVNIRLPWSLARLGYFGIQLVVDGEVSNGATLILQ